MTRINFLSYPVDSLTMAEAIDRLGLFVQEGGFHQIVPINASKLWQMGRNPRLAKIVRSAALIVPEFAVVWGAKKLGVPVRGHVGGVMLLRAVLPVAQERGYRLYFLGAKQEVVSGMVERLQRDYPGLQIVGWHHGYLTPELEAQVVDDIQRTCPDMLFVAMGTPRQEYWIWDRGDRLPVSVCMGVGGSFDVLAGLKQDAPEWTRCGFEWIYRLIQDPLNLTLFKRYLITNPWFVYKVISAKLRSRKG